MSSTRETYIQTYPHTHRHYKTISNFISLMLFYLSMIENRYLFHSHLLYPPPSHVTHLTHTYNSMCIYLWRLLHIFSFDFIFINDIHFHSLYSFTQYFSIFFSISIFKIYTHTNTPKKTNKQTNRVVQLYHVTHTQIFHHPFQQQSRDLNGL